VAVSDVETFKFAIDVDYCAAAYYSNDLQVVAFYELELHNIFMFTVEIRVWSADRSLSKKELISILDAYIAQVPGNIKQGIGSEEVRGVPVGKILRAMQSRVRRDVLVDRNSFEVPSIEEIESVITARLIPDEWRNSRDFRSHARELRAIKVYLHSVFEEQSIQPMRAVSESEGVTIEVARKIIDQSRSHGYLTRANHSVGGTVTDKARHCASLMMHASAEEKAEKK
jgi:hypothetical protein